MDKIKIEYVVDDKRFSDESVARKYAMEVEAEKQRKEKLNKEKEARVNEIVQAKESLERLYCQFLSDYYDYNIETLTLNTFDILIKEFY